MGIVPYEESAGTHCAFVAKIVEYVATGLPAVCTPLKSVRSYFKNDPMVSFSEFDGEDFGGKILAGSMTPVSTWQPHAAQSAARVQAELDWQPLCRKAVDFAEKICSTAKTPGSPGENYSASSLNNLSVTQRLRTMRKMPTANGIKRIK